MRVASNIARILLGLLFLVYGLNGFFRFGHSAPFETAIAREYMGVMLATPYGHVLFALQMVCGIALLCNLFVPLALTILAAYLFNIYMSHLFLDPSKSGSTFLATPLWILTSIRYKGSFRGLLRRNGMAPDIPQVDPDRHPNLRASPGCFRDEVLRMLFHPPSLSLLRATVSFQFPVTSADDLRPGLHRGSLPTILDGLMW